MNKEESASEDSHLHGEVQRGQGSSATCVASVQYACTYVHCTMYSVQ